MNLSKEQIEDIIEIIRLLELGDGEYFYLPEFKLKFRKLSLRAQQTFKLLRGK